MQTLSSHYLEVSHKVNDFPMTKGPYTGQVKSLNGELKMNSTISI